MCTLQITVLLAFAIATNFVAAGNQGKCVMMGMCSDAKSGGDTPCVAHQEGPVTVSSDYFETLKDICPELTAQYGNSLCCDSDQIDFLEDKLGLANAFLGKCPSCVKNLRLVVCNLMCAPDQLLFLNLTESQPVQAEESEGSDGGDGDSAPVTAATPQKHFVSKAEFYMDEKFAVGIYESCKGVVIGAAGGTIMDMLCGKWKSAGCSAHRFFDQVGKAAAGMLSMETKIYLVKPSERGELQTRNVEPLTFEASACDKEPAPGEGKCSCMDCEASCPALEVPKSHTEKTFLQTDNLLYIMIVIAIFGGAIILIAGVTNSVSNQKSGSADLSNGTEMEPKGVNGNGVTTTTENGKSSGPPKVEEDDVVTSVIRSVAVCK